MKSTTEKVNEQMKIKIDEETIFRLMSAVRAPMEPQGHKHVLRFEVTLTDMDCPEMDSVLEWIEGSVEVMEERHAASSLKVANLTVGIDDRDFEFTDDGSGHFKTSSIKQTNQGDTGNAETE